MANKTIKVYFSSSMRSKKYFSLEIETIYQTIGKLGFSHVTDYLVKINPKGFYDRSPKEAANFYKKMISDIKTADICIFEASLESAGIGYSVNMALDLNKPVIILHLGDHKPYLLKMIAHPKAQVIEYSLNDLKEILIDALDQAKEQLDIRFTFFLTPKLMLYLDFIKRERKVARAIFIRRLIEKAMIKDKKFLPSSY